MIDAIGWRGIERLTIDVGGIVFGFLGYRLYKFGVQEGPSKLNLDSAFFKIALAGAGPGIVFMGVGGCVLMIALFQGGAAMDTTVAQNKSTRVPTPTLVSTNDPTVIIKNNQHLLSQTYSNKYKISWWPFDLGGSDNQGGQDTNIVQY